MLLCVWAKLHWKEGWTLKVMQSVPRSCTCAWHQSEKKKKKKLWSFIWEEFQNSPADFISLRFVMFISWEVIKDNCWHLWWSQTTFIFKYFTEKPLSYTMQGATLGRQLVSFLSDFNNSWGGARLFICCVACFLVCILGGRLVPDLHSFSLLSSFLLVAHGVCRYGSKTLP